jgi:hypothetical protein
MTATFAPLPMTAFEDYHCHLRYPSLGRTSFSPPAHHPHAHRRYTLLHPCTAISPVKLRWARKSWQREKKRVWRWARNRQEGRSEEAGHKRFIFLKSREVRAEQRGRPRMRPVEARMERRVATSPDVVCWYTDTGGSAPPRLFGKWRG